ALFEIPSEVEETALRWRTSRLEEHGYPSWEGAQSVYAPPAAVCRRHARAAPPADAPLAPRATLRAIAPYAAIAAAVDTLDAGERERVLFGLSALANRVLVADGAGPGSMKATH